MTGEEMYAVAALLLGVALGWVLRSELARVRWERNEQAHAIEVSALRRRIQTLEIANGLHQGWRTEVTQLRSPRRRPSGGAS